jgi:RND family efflux transporter MFP subunit
MNTRSILALTLGGGLLLSACAPDREATAAPADSVPIPAGETFTVVAAPRTSYLEAAGIAEPFAEATLSTKLMGTVNEVLVREGDQVRKGQTLVRIDARDLAARGANVEAARSEAEAVLDEAQVHAQRMRNLFADQAAPKAQLDAAETAVARARAGVQAARASAAEVAAIRDYSIITAPFTGTVVRRMVDPGSFAAPGAPLLVIQDAAQLRVSVTAAADAARAISRGAEVSATIEGQVAPARLEGIVPAGGGSLYTINAVVANPTGAFLSGGSATLALPQGSREVIVVPERALVRQGDLTGVYLRSPSGARLQWLRVGRSFADSVEIVSGLSDGDRVIVPATPAGGN